MYIPIVLFFDFVITFWHYEMLQAHPIFFLLLPSDWPFLQEFLVLLLENGIGNQDLLLGLVLAAVVSLFLGAIMRQARKYMCAYRPMGTSKF